jgi:hypothetical protein
MTNATSSRLDGERLDRDDSRYLDPASERYATQLAAVVFGWGSWSLEAFADDAGVESSRAAAELSVGSSMDSAEAWAAALIETHVRSA